MRRNDGGVLTSEPHVENPQEEIGPYPVGSNWGWGGGGDLCGVIHLCPSFSDLSIGRVPGEVSHIGQATGALCVQSLEGLGGDPEVGAISPDTVPKM